MDSRLDKILLQSDGKVANGEAWEEPEGELAVHAT